MGATIKQFTSRPAAFARLGTFLLAGVLAGCGGAGGTLPGSMPRTAQSTTVTLRSVTPSSIESGTNKSYDSPDMLTPPVGTAKNRLFVFLPGTGSAPSYYQDILKEAALRGYHAIGLMYVNTTTLYTSCGSSTDPSCWGNYRNEVITGQNTSSLISVTPADSITGRLTALLQYLASSAPSEGWAQYLSGSTPVWQSIHISGHSQGAGDAAYFGKLHAFARICDFDSPGDTTSGANAAWLTLPNVTSPSLHYGFTDTHDTVVAYAQTLANWNALGLAGSPTVVDGASPPFGNSHQLVTNLQAGDPTSTHSLTVIDYATPMTNGSPTFAPVWDTICLP
jgi:hypothetical protein